MALREYRRKRNFGSTKEPFGKKTSKSSKRLTFVIQKHAASRLHYDFRLELNGVLKSWAVPKGPSLDPHIKRLAVQVEDHPLEYGKFEGTIPQGEYGGGSVLLWDRGIWEPLDKDEKVTLEEGKIKFLLKGKKLHGAWTLVRIGDTSNWLLMKETDEYASDEDITELLPKSVRSGKVIEAIGRSKASRVWHSHSKKSTASTREHTVRKTTKK